VRRDSKLVRKLTIFLHGKQVIGIIEVVVVVEVVEEKMK
jgi:hypothetical protein